MCVCLLELGSDTTAINEFAITPLHQASASEQDQFGSRTIEFLLDCKFEETISYFQGNFLTLLPSFSFQQMERLRSTAHRDRKERA